MIKYAAVMVFGGKMEQLSILKCIDGTEENGILSTDELAAIHPRMVSLFSGCGRLDWGFKEVGYDIVYASDFDKDAQRVYEASFGEMSERSTLDVPAEEVPGCDILTAGFPCQPSSNAGNQKGVNDSRGNLYKECLQIIETKKPKVVVFENVRGLLLIRDEEGSLLIDTIARNLGDIGEGYRVNYQLINASDYGVPRNRVRVAVVAFRKDLGKTFVFPPKQLKEGLNMGNSLDIPADVPNQVDWPFSPQALSLIRHIPEGGSWRSIPYRYLPDRSRRIADNMKRYHAPNIYRRFSRDETVRTITAVAQPENYGIIHPTENRRYNVREIARIQISPDEFVFSTEDSRSVTGIYRVIGNAVLPTLAKVIGMETKRQLDNQFMD